MLTSIIILITTIDGAEAQYEVFKGDDDATTEQINYLLCDLTALF